MADQPELGSLSKSYPAPSSDMLPAELVDMVIDHLHNDHPSLKACSQVSSTWLTSSRFHLFEKILVKVSPEFERDHLAAIIRYFETPAGTLCRTFVHRLTIKGSENDLVTGARAGYILLQSLGRMLNALPRVEALVLSSVTWLGLAPGGPPPLTSLSVVSLIVMRSVHLVHNDITNNIRVGMDILSLLPSLKRLHTIGGPWERQVLTPHSAPVPVHSGCLYPPKLEFLDIRTEGAASIFVQYALNKLDFTALTKLSVCWFCVDDLPSLGRLITAATSLQHVDLRLGGVFFYDDDDLEPTTECQKLNLGQCTTLKNLDLFVPMELDDGGIIPFWDVAIAIIETLPESISDICLRIESNVHMDDLMDVLCSVDWDAQRRAYGRLPNLRRVLFAGGISGHSDCLALASDVSELIETQLDTLVPRGILKFS